jgi:Tfp pilus assembly protein PilN
MRVNLLPRDPETIRFVGNRVDLGDLRRLVGLALLGIVSLLASSGIQVWREHRLTDTAVQSEKLLERHAPQRLRVSALAREVALLQRIDQESALARHSGNDAAVALARLGNAIPSGAWLNALDRRPDGYFVTGGARDLTTVARTLDGLASATSSSRAHLAGIGLADGRLTFSIRVSTQNGSAR